MKCKVCGKRLRLRKSDRYEIKKIPTGLNCLVEDVKVFEAFDCQRCGCQNIVGVREIGEVENEKPGNNQE